MEEAQRKNDPSLDALLPGQAAARRARVPRPGSGC
jgi:hypothetical protein